MADTIVQKSGTDMVYLVPNADDPWKTVITDTPPAPAAAVLSAEEDYPVEVYYRRTDLNGSGTIEMDYCQNREELTRSLDWIGQCGHLILSFWTFQHDMPMENALTEILDKAYERGYKQRQQAPQSGGDREADERRCCPRAGGQQEASQPGGDREADERRRRARSRARTRAQQPSAHPGGDRETDERWRSGRSRTRA